MQEPLLKITLRFTFSGSNYPHKHTFYHIHFYSNFRNEFFSLIPQMSTGYDLEKNQTNDRKFIIYVKLSYQVGIYEHPPCICYFSFQFFLKILQIDDQPNFLIHADLGKLVHKRWRGWAGE